MYPIFHSQSIDFTHAFAQVDITSGEPLFIEIPRNFKSDGRKFDVFIMLKKNLYGQAKSVRLWYENLQSGLLYRSFVASKVGLCLFISKNVICVVYVDDCIFLEILQYDIGNIIKYFKEDGTSYNWYKSKGKSVSEFLGIDINTLDDGGFQFCQTGLICKVLE